MKKYIYFFHRRKKAYGYYSEIRYWYNEKDFLQEEKVFEIPVMYDEKGYNIKEGVEVTEEQREKIMNFKFKFQYLNFQPETISKYKVLRSNYNSNADLYSITYKVNKIYNNVEALVKENNDEDIIENAPHLEIFMNRMGNSVGISLRYGDRDGTYFKYSESITHNLKTTKFRDEYLENVEVE